MSTINQGVVVTPNIPHVVDFKKGTITFTETPPPGMHFSVCAVSVVDVVRRRRFKGKRKIAKWWTR
jgi:hypothetical protein